LLSNHFTLPVTIGFASGEKQSLALYQPAAQRKTNGCTANTLLQGLRRTTDSIGDCHGTAGTPEEARLTHTRNKNELKASSRHLSARRTQHPSNASSDSALIITAEAACAPRLIGCR
jgi:hypothetical protein